MECCGLGNEGTYEYKKTEVVAKTVGLGLDTNAT